MKRFFALLIAVASLISLCACDLSKPDPTSSSQASSAVQSNSVSSAESAPLGPYSERTINICDNFDKFGVMGRYYLDTGSKQLYLDNPASKLSFTADCEGDIELWLNVKVQKDDAESPYIYYTVKVDGEVTNERLKVAGTTSGNDTRIQLAQSLERGEHTVELIRESAASYGTTSLLSITLNGTLLEAPEKRETYIEFLGDSLTVGYANLFERAEDDKALQGNAVYQNALKTYSAATAEALGADYSIIARSTSTIRNMIDNMYLQASNGRRGHEWGFERKSDIIVINLGTYDYTEINSGKLTLKQFQKDVRELLTLVRATNPEAKIVYAYGIYSGSKFLGDYVKLTLDALGGEKNGYYYCDLSGHFTPSSFYPTVSESAVFTTILTEFLEANCLPSE